MPFFLLFFFFFFFLWCALFSTVLIYAKESAWRTRESLVRFSRRSMEPAELWRRQRGGGGGEEKAPGTLKYASPLCSPVTNAILRKQPTSRAKATPVPFYARSTSRSAQNQPWLRRCHRPRATSPSHRKTVTGWWFWDPPKSGKRRSCPGSWTEGSRSSTRRPSRIFTGNCTALRGTFTNWTYWIHQGTTRSPPWGDYPSWQVRERASISFYF